VARHPPALVLEAVQAVRLVPSPSGFQNFHPILVDLFLFVLDHRIPGNFRLVSGYFELMVEDTSVHVVVLPAPAPELVRVPVQPPEVVDGEGGDTAEKVLVGQLVIELVHGHGHVTRLGRARVQVPVVLWKQVDVVKDTALPGLVLGGLHEADVEEHGPIEGGRVGLIDDVDPVLHLLALQERVNVAKKRVELIGTVPVGHYDGYFIPGCAVLWLVFPPGLDFGIFRRDSGEVHSLLIYFYSSQKSLRNLLAHRQT